MRAKPLVAMILVCVSAGCEPPLDLADIAGCWRDPMDYAIGLGAPDGTIARLDVGKTEPVRFFLDEWSTDRWTGELTLASSHPWGARARLVFTGDDDARRELDITALGESFLHLRDVDGSGLGRLERADCDAPHSTEP